MTLFDILVPVAAIAVAGVGVVIVRMTDRRSAAPARPHRHHPAE